MPSNRHGPPPTPANRLVRALGLDLGSKRVGVAVSDSDGRVATPVEVLQRTGDRKADHRAVSALVEDTESHVSH